VEWVEVTGRTVDEAKEAALDQLGVDEADAEFEIVDEPRGGLLGRLRAEARVRARVLPTKPRPKLERRDRRARERSVSRRSGASTADTAGPRDADGGGSDPVRDDDAPPAPSLDAEADAAAEFLVGLLDALDADASVSSRIGEEATIEVSVTGDDLGLLIGPKGQTLAAVQELTRTAVQHRLGGRQGRLLVDVSEYRRKRRAALERFTQQVAQEVKATGAPRVLEPMSPADRKVVHDTVNAIAGVTTTSEGEEPHRRVAILPERS
jgi:spoIIIJ-associated protein